jgi:Na+/melibiose symporter-like transporter
MASSTPPLSLRTKLAFGVGSVAEGAIYIAFNTWNFLFYNHVLGLSGTLCGLAVTLSLLIDAVADPVVGSLSDRLRSRLGRRHPFLYATALPLAVTFYCLYVPPAGLSSFALFLWFTLFATLHRVAMTFYHVPHLALGAELTADYRERSIVMGYNALFQVVGGAGAGFLGWSRFARLPGGTTARDNYAGVALGVAAVSALAILISAHFTRDQIPRLARPSHTHRFSMRALWLEIADCLRNQNYRNLLLGYLLLGAMLGMRETLDSYTGLFFWQLPEKSLRVFGLVSPPAYLAAFFVTARLHRSFEKRHTIIGSAAISAFAAVTPISLRLLHLMPANGAPGVMTILLSFYFLFYLGIAMLTISVMSALADVADEHELTTGKRQEGIFFAARTLFSKISSGGGHIIAGLGIDLIHFPAAAKPGQVPDSTLFELGVLNGPLAAVPALLAVVFYARYHIDRKRLAEIQRELAERRKTASVPSAPELGLVNVADPLAAPSP